MRFDPLLTRVWNAWPSIVPLGERLDVARVLDDLRAPIRRYAVPHGIAVDLAEREGELWLSANLPGVDAGGIELSLEDDVLSLRAERRASLPEGARYLRRERDEGVVERRLRLPRRVDRDRVEARFENGVLEVRLPLAEEERPRRIEVRPGGGREES